MPARKSKRVRIDGTSKSKRIGCPKPSRYLRRSKRTGSSCGKPAKRRSYKKHHGPMRGGQGCRKPQRGGTGCPYKTQRGGTGCAYRKPMKGGYQRNLGDSQKRSYKKRNLGPKPITRF